MVAHFSQPSMRSALCLILSVERVFDLLKATSLGGAASCSKHAISAVESRHAPPQESMASARYVHIDARPDMLDLLFPPEYSLE